MKKQKYRWLNRRIAHPGPYLTLCLSEKEFEHAIKHLKIKEHFSWIRTPQADATAHHFSNPDGHSACVVCLRNYEGRDPVEVAGLLIHEAVHVWQEYCEWIGEQNPAREQEAYAIQAISQELLAEFARRMR